MQPSNHCNAITTRNTEISRRAVQQNTRSRWEQFNANSNTKERETRRKQQIDDDDVNTAALPASPSSAALQLRGVCSVNINVNSGQPRLNSQPTPIMVPQRTEAGCIWGRHSTERAPTHPTSNTVFPPSAVKSSAEKKSSASLETIRLSGLHT